MPPAAPGHARAVIAPRPAVPDPAVPRHAWAEPGPEPVAEGVVRIPLPLPSDALRAVNVYVLVSDTDLTLVDGGWAISEAREVLRRGLAGLGADVGDIRRFLVTHLHRDHYTQAAALGRETGADVALGVGERESLARIGVDAPLQQQFAALHRCGAGALAEHLRELVGTGGGEDIGAGGSQQQRPATSDFPPPDRWLSDGQELTVAGRRLVAVETPGHTRGHLVFTDDTLAPPGSSGGGTGLLFAGDHVLPHITPSIGFEPDPRPGALGRFLASLAKVRAMGDRTLLPAHGPAGGSTHVRVDELLDHHRRRLDAAAAVVGDADGPVAAVDVAGVLTWTRRETALTDLEPFQRMLAVLETDAHLEVLAAEDRLRRTSGSDGVVLHRPEG